jgi:hypothetical protein
MAPACASALNGGETPPLQGDSAALGSRYLVSGSSGASATGWAFAFCVIRAIEAMS